MGTAKHPHDSSRPMSAAVRKAYEAGDIEGLKAAFSPRCRAFCEEYVVDFNGAAAVVRAGYSTNYADRQAHVMKKNPGVQMYIDHLMAKRPERISLVDPDYVIAQVTAIISKPEAKDGDRLRGLELLARHLGMFIDRTEITGKDGGAIELERKVEEDATALIHLLNGMKEKAPTEVEII